MTKLDQAMDAAVIKGFGRQQDGKPTGLGITGMEKLHLDTLLRNGMLRGVNNEDLTQDDTLCEGLNLVYCNDSLDCLLGDDDEIELMPFLMRMFLAEYEAEYPQFCLVSPDALAILLPKFIGRYTTKISSIASAPKESRYLQSKTSFCGRHYVCDWSFEGMLCGDPLCHSEFAWVQNRVCLLNMSGGLAGINSAQFYPYYTT